MYDRAGFRVVERVDDARYTVPLTGVRMELALDVPPARAAASGAPG
jgi:hypothetical protein